MTVNNFIRYWNQNRKKIIIIIAIIALLIILLRVVNNYLKNAPKPEVNNPLSNQTIDKTIPMQSTITGTSVSEEVTKQNIDYIKEFIEYCNQKEYQKAYNLLSEDCKKEYNDNINNFVNQYCNNIFTTSKTYNLELWIANEGKYTYKIKYINDNLLATGGANLNKNIEDYITIVKQADETKLNVNGFICKKELNKTQKYKDVEIVISSKTSYKNYETYEITIKNYTDKTILVSDGKSSKNICLVDQNEVEYAAFLDEVPLENLEIPSKYGRRMTIKFNKIYDIYRIIEKMRFKTIILDKEIYEKNSEDSNLEKMQMEIEI